MTRVRLVDALALGSIVVLLLTSGVVPAVAQNIGHLGKNRLVFASVDPAVLPEATGSGIVEYQGGREPSSQWRASFRFAGLEAGATYTVVIQGRFGARGSPEAARLTPLCAFTADETGAGAASGISGVWRG